MRPNSCPDCGHTSHNSRGFCIRYVGPDDICWCRNLFHQTDGDFARQMGLQPDKGLERLLKLISGRPNEEMIPIGDVRVALYVGEATVADVQRGLELAKERGW